MAKQKLNFSVMGKKAAEAGHQLAAQDRAQEGAVAAARTDLPIDQIMRRPGGDTRQVDLQHALALAESIAAIGLLEPIAIDCKNRLVAGAHRLAALRILAAANRVEEVSTYLLTAGLPDAAILERIGALPADPASWRVIPVHRLALDVDQDPATALAAEVAENERRRDYTRSEIKGLAERLKDAGFKHTRGRPKTGERALLPALEVIVGKSRVTLWRILEGEPLIVSRETINGPEAQAAKKIEAAIHLLVGHPQYTTLVQSLREVVIHLTQSFTSRSAPASTPPPEQTADGTKSRGNTGNQPSR